MFPSHGILGIVTVSGPVLFKGRSSLRCFPFESVPPLNLFLFFLILLHCQHITITMVFVCLFCFPKQYKGTHPWNLTTEDRCAGSSMATSVLALALSEATDYYCLNPVVRYITIPTKLPTIQRSHPTLLQKTPMSSSCKG